MKILDPGHAYQLACYDGDDLPPLIFMKRVGAKYPGNVGTHPGTNCQEVLRALIDRVQYLDAQVHAPENVRILNYLRRALWEFEMRASRLHWRTITAHPTEIETVPTCETCGHIECEHMQPVIPPVAEHTHAPSDTDWCPICEHAPQVAASPAPPNVEAIIKVLMAEGLLASGVPLQLVRDALNRVAEKGSDV